jgi:putative NADH-flavin reductase
VRDPARLDYADHPRLEPVIADALDPEAIRPVLAGRHAVVSALGPRARTDGSVCADGARAIITAMRAACVRRLVVVTASGHVVDPHAGQAVTAAISAGGIRRLRPHRTGRPRQRPGLDWTIMRPPRLTDGKPRRYRTAMDRNVRGSITIARVDLADAILGVLDAPATAGHTISLGY